jgi:hypothetical protein
MERVQFIQLFNSQRDWSERSFLVVFVFGFGAIWMTAVAGALYQLRIANSLLWFYALGAGLIDAISHFVFSILKGGYFPRLYTATGAPLVERGGHLPAGHRIAAGPDQGDA